MDDIIDREVNMHAVMFCNLYLLISLLVLSLRDARAHAHTSSSRTGLNRDLLFQNIQGMTGTPMVAASPERHDGGIQANPVEVQSYQPPWKVLSDFALQSDMEQPSFQQLVCASALHWFYWWDLKVTFTPSLLERSRAGLFSRWVENI